jgi:hypothetical protein
MFWRGNTDTLPCGHYSSDGGGECARIARKMLSTEVAFLGWGSQVMREFASFRGVKSSSLCGKAPLHVHGDVQGNRSTEHACTQIQLMCTPCTKVKLWAAVIVNNSKHNYYYYCFCSYMCTNITNITCTDAMPHYIQHQIYVYPEG